VIDKLFNIKGLVGTLAAGALLGFGGGSWFSGAVQAKKDLKTTQAALTAEQEARKRQVELTNDEVERANRLSLDLQDTRQALNDAIQANAVIAASRAATHTKTILEGEKIGTELEGNYAWIRYAIPDELRLYANGDDTGGVLPPSEKVGY
jgi:hypothetical protein